MATGFVFHEKYLWHDTGSQWLIPPNVPPTQPLAHRECPESKRRFKNLLDATELSRILVDLSPRPATCEEILRVHTDGYVTRIAELSAAGGGDAGEDAPFGRGSYEIALLAAGGAIVAVVLCLRAKLIMPTP